MARKTNAAMAAASFAGSGAAFHFAFRTDSSFQNSGL